MSLTQTQIHDLHAAHLARGETAAEALQGTRTEAHAILLAAHPPEARCVEHTAEQAHHHEAHHGTDLWDEVDRLVHGAGLAPEPTPVAKTDRVIAGLAGHAYPTRAMQRAGIAITMIGGAK